MRYALIAVCVFLLCDVCQGPAVDAQKIRRPTPQRPRQTDIEFKERAAKRRKFIACYEAGKGECYRKYAESVKWCRENWEKCFPLIPGLGVHAGTYGKQVLEECKAKLRRRCREEAGL